MNPDGDTITDEYIVTALQIFNYCGADSSSTLRVDVLMEKFAPFIKTNKAEYSFLKSLLDPDQTNPEINVSELAATLNKYSESQKVKADLDESFNLRSGQVPHDSDSGISTDGFQLLEELQCELREKAHVVQQLRTQLDYTDRHHEEALAAVTAERDNLRAHLNMLREESTALSQMRRDYDEACERLGDAERARDRARRDLDDTRRRGRVLAEQVAVLETEKLTLQELLSKSKDECHRMNEMYASRQAALRGETETLRAERAELAARLQDQDEFMQQLIKEKVLLEMELKDMLNKSNQTHLRLNHSIDTSYTDDQMLTALDSLNADSRFVQEGRLLDEEAFVRALKEDQGRVTNMSLYDEIRLSFCNMSRHNMTELNCTEPLGKTSELLDTSLKTVATQTENVKDEICQNCKRRKFDDIIVINFGTQTQECELSIISNKDDNGSSNYFEKIPNSHNTYDNEPCARCFRDQIETKNQSTNTNVFVLEVFKDVEVMNMGTQTNDLEPYLNNNNVETCIDCSKCIECENVNKYVTKLEKDLKLSHSAVTDMQKVLDKYEDNLNVLKRFVDEGNERNNGLRSVIDSLRAKLLLLEQACDSQRDDIQEMCRESYSIEMQTECEQSSVSTQTELPCSDCVKQNSHRSIRRFLWDPLKCLFQVFAVLCFASALYVLYIVTGARRACREPLPWRWLQPHDLLDLFLTVEYVDHVPM